MKPIRFSLSVLLCLLLIKTAYAQDLLEVDGRAKIIVMDQDSTTTDIVVKQTDGTLAVRDISTLSEFPVSLSFKGSVGIGPAPQSIYVSGRYAYLVDGASDDLKVVDVSDPTSPEVVGSLALGVNPGFIFVAGRYAYVTDISEDDLRIIDVSDPSAPVQTGSINFGSSPRSVYVSGRYAYTVNDGSHDLKVVDVIDPTNPKLSGNLVIGDDPQSVFVSGRYAYVTDGDAEDLKVIDVTDPEDPILAGSLGIGLNPGAIYVSGRYAYVLETNPDELKVIDISNPALPFLTGTFALARAPRSIFVSGRYAYVTEVFFGDVGMEVIDISDPTLPALAADLDPVLVSSPLSVYVSGRFAYIVDDGLDELIVVEMSGAEYTSLMAHSLEAGNLQVRNDILAQGQIQVTGGLTVGNGGIFTDGDIGANGSLQVIGDIFQITPGKVAQEGLIIEGDASTDRVKIELRNEDTGGHNYSMNSSGGTAAVGQGKWYVRDETASANRMVIDDTGNVGIGRNNPSHPLHMQNGAHVTSGGVWTNSSDRANKTNIVPLTYGLDEILRLRPSSYNYIADQSKSIGFIAQEMEQVLPEVVSGEEGSKGIAYGPIVAVLVNAIKEQQAEITFQRSEISTLKEEMAELRALLTEVMALAAAGKE